MSPMSTLMPAAFIGHGNPMNAIEHNRYTESLVASSVRRCREPQGDPRDLRALVRQHHRGHRDGRCRAPFTTSTGSPQELFSVEYPAPGDPSIADRIVDVVQPTYVGLDEDSWGIDHGTWSVLVHMFPAADVPVLQLSINAELPFDYHFNLGAQLHALRTEGVLIIGSGNVVHNLRLVDFNQPGVGTDWAHRFDDDMRDIMTGDADRAGTGQRARGLPPRRADARPLLAARVRGRSFGRGQYADAHVGRRLRDGIALDDRLRTAGGLTYLSDVPRGSQ